MLQSYPVRRRCLGIFESTHSKTTREQKGCSVSIRECIAFINEHRRLCNDYLLGIFDTSNSLTFFVNAHGKWCMRCCLTAMFYKITLLFSLCFFCGRLYHLLWTCKELNHNISTFLKWLQITSPINNCGWIVGYSGYLAIHSVQTTWLRYCHLLTRNMMVWLYHHHLFEIFPTVWDVRT